jgi:FAD/FMN-containing dehydrogenase
MTTQNPAKSALFERLAARLGPKGWSTDSDIVAPHLSEWRGRYHGATPFLALPRTTEEVADIVRTCAEAGVAITPQGGNTGLVGAQIPDGEVLLSTKRLNAIRLVSKEDDALIAEAGVILKIVQDAARAADRLFPLSLASEGAATIGGLISTNAGGVHVVRYGMMRDLVLGLEVVLADGRVLDALKLLRKDNTGYDLKQAFIGAEGTLGVITAAALKLFPKPAEHVVCVAGVASPDRALDLLHHMKGETGALVAFEIMNRLCIDLVLKNVPGNREPLAGYPYLTLIEFESVRPQDLRGAVENALAGAIEKGFAENAVIAENETQARAFWRVREDISAAHRPEGAQANHDISVPVSAVPAFLREAERAVHQIAPGARIVEFGHAGDGNIHYTVVRPADAKDEAFWPLLPHITEAAQDVAIGLGGSISAEHGIGVARREELPRYKSAEHLTAMAAIKAALDPKRIMNPRALT